MGQFGELGLRKNGRSGWGNMCVVWDDKKQIYQRLLVLKVQCYLWVSRWHTPSISFRWMCVHICAFKSVLTAEKLCVVVPEACGVRFWEGICPCLVSIAEREWLAQTYPNGYASNYYFQKNNHMKRNVSSVLKTFGWSLWITPLNRTANLWETVRRSSISPLFHLFQLDLSTVGSN